MNYEETLKELKWKGEIAYFIEMGILPPFKTLSQIGKIKENKK